MCGYFCIGFIDFMLKGKSLTDFTNLFSSNNFKKNDDIISNYFKMGEYNSFEAPSIYANLDDQQLRLKKVNDVKDYFIAEIKERKLISKRLSKYIASFDYFDKSFFICNKW